MGIEIIGSSLFAGTKGRGSFISVIDALDMMFFDGWQEDGIQTIEKGLSRPLFSAIATASVIDRVKTMQHDFKKIGQETYYQYGPWRVVETIDGKWSAVAHYTIKYSDEYCKPEDGNTLSPYTIVKAATAEKLIVEMDAEIIRTELINGKDFLHWGVRA